MMEKYPSEAAKELAAQLNGVEIGEESQRIPKDAKERGLVVVYGASDDLMAFRGAIYDEVSCYEGGIVYVKGEEVFDEGYFDCGCQWAEKAKANAKANAKTIEAIWADVDEYSWAYRTDIPHVGFDVMEDGEKYCRGIVFDLAALS